MTHDLLVQPSAEEWLQKGYDACLAGAIETAIEAFRQSTRVEPLAEITHLMALNNLGSLLSQRGETEEALACMERVLHYRLYPDPAIREQVALAQHNKGLLLRGQGDFQGAVACFDEVIRHHPPGDPQVDLRTYWLDASLARIDCLLSAGETDQALTSYGDLLASHPEADTAELEYGIAATLYNKGVRSKEAGDEEQAGKHYECLIRNFRTSSHAPVQFVLACALNNQNSILAAGSDYAAALAGFQQVVAEFSPWQEPQIQEQVRHAAQTAGQLCNVMAFECILQAKRAWTNEAKRQEYVQEALRFLHAALESPCEPRWLIEGNAAYAHWLLDSRATAQTFLLAALRAGGERLRDIELEDSANEPVPTDSGFRDLVWQCWSQTLAENPLSDASSSHSA